MSTSTSTSTSFLQSFGQQRPPKRPAFSLASTSMKEFHTVLQSSTRILALCGAGLSAASGLDTFRGTGGMWRNYRATALATPEAFENDPGLVWLFYAYRRHKALQAKPNMGHYALAEMASRIREKGFMCLTQNVDGLSQRAKHPPEQLKLLHSSLFNLKCVSCPYRETDNFSDPLHPSLLIDEASITARLSPASKLNPLSNSVSFLDPSKPPTIPLNDLPHCPSCKSGLLRPDVVWFDEALPKDTLAEVDEWISKDQIDLCLVIGTTATVYPAASYVQEARKKGARVAVVNIDSKELGSAGSLNKDDFLFEGNAALVLPEMLRPIVGRLEGFLGDLGDLVDARKEEVGEDQNRNDGVEEEEEMDEVQKYFAASP